MYVALKEAGVDTVLIRMNGEWHGTGRKNLLIGLGHMAT